MYKQIRQKGLKVLGNSTLMLLHLVTTTAIPATVINPATIDSLTSPASTAAISSQNLSQEKQSI